MASEKLTKGAIDAAVPRADKPNSDLYLWDRGKGSVSGFGLKVTPAGSKSFVFQYRMRGAKTDRRYKIGRYGDWTVDRARERAKALRIMVDSTIDPLEHDRAQAKAGEIAKLDAVERAFDKVADAWLDTYKVERRQRGARKGRVRSASTIEMATTAVRFLKGQLKKARIDEIGERELSAALGKIPATKVATRRNTFATARILWGWAARQKLIVENPFDRLEVPAAPASRERTLADDELIQVWRGADATAYPFGPIFRLLILTGQRREEIAGMSWAELDRAAKEWRVPSSRTKNGLPHIVPLSDQVVGVLDTMAPPAAMDGKVKWPSKGLLFTTTGQTPVSGHSGAKRRLDAQIAKFAAEAEIDPLEDWRVHDLRRTIATGLQRLGVRFEVTEAVLNHVSGARGGIAGIYQKHHWAEEKRAALEAWARHVDALLAPADKSNVVRLEVT